MTSSEALVQSLQRQLVAHLEQIRAIRSPAVRAAFCTIPRHPFLPCYYEQEGSTLL